MERVTVKAELKGEFAKKFKRIKEELGVSANTEVVRVLIKRFSLGEEKPK